MDDFSTAKVGDNLWSLRYGEVVVTKVCKDWLLGRYGKCGQSDWWSLDGINHFGEVTPDLYWSKPEIIAPPRLVEEKWEFWMNLYPGRAPGGAYLNQGEADYYADSDRIGPAERIVITRMVPA